MSKYEIAAFIVCSINGFICYLIGYMVGITHDKDKSQTDCGAKMKGADNE